MLLCIKQKLPAHYCPFDQIFPGPVCCVCHHNGSEAFLGTTMYVHNRHLNITQSSSLKTSRDIDRYNRAWTSNSQATTGMKWIRKFWECCQAFYTSECLSQSQNNVRREKKEGVIWVQDGNYQSPKLQTKHLSYFREENFKIRLNAQDHWKRVFLKFSFSKVGLIWIESRSNTGNHL